MSPVRRIGLRTSRLRKLPQPALAVGLALLGAIVLVGGLITHSILLILVGIGMTGCGWLRWMFLQPPKMPRMARPGLGEPGNSIRMAKKLDDRG